MSAYARMIQEQLEEGLRSIQHTANQLMHEIASEVWRTAGGDKDEVQGKLLEALSRDQTIRSLIAHTDERFQTLAVRTARVEDTLNMVAEGMRSAREQLARGVDALEDVQASPAAQGVAEIRTRLDEVTRQIALAFETLAERDHAIVEAVQQRVREHGELVSTETARIAMAMEGYVQQGVAAMGQLAGSVENQITAIAGREDAIGGRLAQAAEAQMQLLDDRIRTISERVAADSTTVSEAVTYLLDTTDERNRSLGEYLELINDRVGMETRDVLMAIGGMESRATESVRGAIDERMVKVEITAHDAAIRSAREINHTLESRIMGLAELVRSDSLTLRNELVRSATTQDEAIARTLDERLGRVSETLSTATNWMVEEITRRIREESIQAIRGRLDDALSAIERQGEDNASLLNGRLDDAVSAIDRNVVRMSDSLEGQLERLARSVGERSSLAVDVAIRERFDDVTSRMHDAMTALEGATAEVSEASGKTEEAVSRAQIRTEETVMQAVDARVAGLAKMIRSDNESLGRQIVADQEASKQALRAMKELQANLPADVIETVQRRMDDLAESVAKSQEMLAQRIDRMAAKIGERYDNDIQIVIDRMGDAMHALASLGREPQGNGAGEDRIELE